MVDTLSSFLKPIRREIKQNVFISHYEAPVLIACKALLLFICHHVRKHSPLARCDGSVLKGIGELEQLKFIELVALLKRSEAWS
jgi:hypothetical protein